MRKMIVLVAVLCLSACSSSIVYNNADTLLDWWIGKYIDFTDAQQPIVDQTIEEWLVWHRENELPLYRDQLLRLRSAITDGTLTKDQLAQHFDDAQAHTDRIRIRIAPDVAKMAVTLNLDQLSQLFATIKHERTERAEDYSQRQRKQPKRSERIIDTMSEYLGRMNSQQKALVEDYSEQLNPTYDLWREYGDVSNQTARQILLTAGFDQHAETKLANFIVDQAALQPPALQSAANQNKALYIDMLWAIFPTLNETQRENLTEKIDDYLALIDSLT